MTVTPINSANKLCHCHTLRYDIDILKIERAKMKLIDDERFLNVQVSWFEKQIKAIAIDNWNVTGISEKDQKVKECLKHPPTITFDDLEGLRSLLNSTGLKKLSNTIASAKKRKNSNKKSLQLMLDKNVISNLEKSAKSKGMSISEFITDHFGSE